MAKYRVLERSFINGHLREAGSTIELEIDSPGSNLQLVDAPKVVTVDAKSTAGGDAPAFAPKHNGGGRYIVIDASGNKVGDFSGTKEEAQAEVQRLLAGGDPASGESNGAAETTAGGESSGTDLPDA